MVANPHQDIHDALGIIPVDDAEHGHEPWHSFESRWPKDYYDPDAARGLRISPQVVPGGYGWTENAVPTRVAANDDPHSDIHAALGIRPTGPALSHIPILQPDATANDFLQGGGVGASPTMNKLFPEATYLGASGHLTQQEYVNKLGGTSEFAKNFPTSFKKMEPYLVTEDKLGWKKIEDSPQFKKLQGDADSYAPNISDEAIVAALKKNPGASIMDIAGIHHEGPTSDLSTKVSSSRLEPEDFPREVPFNVPEKAQQLGFTVPALHGTSSLWWKDNLDVLKLPEAQLGVHFGNPKQASMFSTRGGLEDDRAQRTYPAVLQMQNPLEMKDLGSWGPGHVKAALEEINAGEHLDYAGSKKLEAVVVSPEAQGRFPPDEVAKLKDIGDVRDYIASKGYDSVKYTNAVEDRGHPSYILFHESPTMPGYVIGARSPFAQFDPSKLHLPNLAAGIGALGVGLGALGASGFGHSGEKGNELVPRGSQ